MKEVVLILLITVASAQAQWQTEGYALKGGWNSIYLHGDATHTTIDTLFASTPEVEEVWRWVPNPDQVQFTSTPLLPSAGTPEWMVWARGGVANTLTQMPGQAAYLVKCAGSVSNSYHVSITQRPLPPSVTWVRNGANLLGFPTKLSGNYPTFSNYFATFPAALASGSKIYQYAGGDLSATNPLQVFSPISERLDRHRAYWFESEVVGNFHAPLHITLSQASGLDFGRTRSVVTARLLNRSAAIMTVTIAPQASDPAPLGQDAITGGVPLTRRTFDGNTASWMETPLVPFNQVIDPQSSVELSFGIDRGTMGGTPNAFFASLLRFTDAANRFDILIPATARKGTLAGLWIGDALVKAVESKPDADAVTPAGRSYPLRYLLHVADDGSAHVLSQIFVGPMAAAPHDVGLCTKQSGLHSASLDNATRIVSAHLPLDRVVNVGTLTSVTDTLTGTINIPFDDPTNPFVHQYHPDHDNKAANGDALEAGVESYTIIRSLTFNFTAAPPAGSSVTSGWGSQVIGGTYGETITGLHKDTSGLQLTGTFELRRALELGSLTITLN